MAPPCESGRGWTRAVKMTLCLFFLIPMSLARIQKTNTIFGKQQKLEVQQQLKRLNKPALKTIKSPDGDIIDCINIKNQPAFDHPLMKNHTIQMRPSFVPKGIPDFKVEITQLWHLNGSCPEGTIPIRRTKEEDLLRASSIVNYGRKKYDIIPNDDNNENIHEYATVMEEGVPYYGMNAEMSIWNPHVHEENEFSLAQFWLIGLDNNGRILDTIEAGAMVYYDLFGDYNTRLFTFWTNNGYASGCYNLGCENGFVHLDSRVALGATFFPHSEYGGTQNAINIFVYKDNVDGHWWLQLNHRHVVGYWPNHLFSVLSNSASRVKWGGEVVDQKIGGQHTTTQMGSGHYAEEGPGRAALFQNLKVMVAEQFLRGPVFTHHGVTNPNCYNLLPGVDFFYYGGPGRNPNCP